MAIILVVSWKYKLTVSSAKAGSSSVAILSNWINWSLRISYDDHKIFLPCINVLKNKQRVIEFEEYIIYPKRIEQS